MGLQELSRIVFEAGKLVVTGTRGRGTLMQEDASEEDKRSREFWRGAEVFPRVQSFPVRLLLHCKGHIVI